MTPKNLVGLAAASVVLLAAAARGDTAPNKGSGMHPYPLWPSTPVPGWPGVGADEEHTIEKLTGGSPSDPRPAIYGQPEFLAYPGAVHHVRREYQRYNPPYPLFNARTLVKNFVLSGMAAFRDKCTAFAEPVYYNPMYGRRSATKQRRPFVKAYAWKPGGPPVRLTLGKLERGPHVIRPIAAAPSVRSIEPRKFVFVKLRINDWPDDPDRWNAYILRAQTLDNFYALQQFHFQARDDRVFRAELTLLPGSEVDLLLHNVDLHYRNAELARRRGKKRAVLIDPEVRAADWDRAREAGGKRLQARLEQQRRTPEAQKQLDDFIWQCYMPPLNCHWPGWAFWIQGTGRDLDQLRVCQAPAEWEELVRRYDSAFAAQYGEGKKHPFFLRCKSGTIYKDGRNGLHADPPAYELRGVNVYERVKKDDKWAPGELLGPLSDFELSYAKPGNSGYKALGQLVLDGKAVGAWRTLLYLDGKLYKDGKVIDDEPRRAGSPYSRFYDIRLRQPLVAQWRVKPGLYYDASKGSLGGNLEREAANWFKYGERQAVHDAAMKFVCQTYNLVVAQIRDPLHGLGVVGGSAGPDRCLLKYFTYGSTSGIEFYDKIYDFVSTDKEFAKAVGRYILGIATPDDVVAFLDTYVIQYYANLIVKQRQFTDHGTPALLMKAVLVQDDTSISDPWMEFLFTRAWEYPQALSGLGDNLVTGGGRDGGSNIGSFFYALGGQMKPVELLEQYLQNGGNRKYDLTDPGQYPNSRFTPYFALEASAAGRHNPGVGDVGGPAEYYGRFVDHAGLRSIMATGWRWHRDPKFAWELARSFGRKGETDAEWAEILQAAQKCPRDPYLMNRSRALSNWGGYITSNPGLDDFRFLREAIVRVGTGWGHAHSDTLDLRLFALGCTMAGDFNQRPAYGWPRHQMTRCHNVVEVDGKDWMSHAWVRNVFDAPGSQYMAAESTPPFGMEHVKLFRRQVALVDVHGGKPSAKDNPAKDPDVALPSSYLFDVFRVDGGKMHTYCFHGCVDDGFEANVKDKAPPTREEDSPDDGYLNPFRWWVAGDAKEGEEPDYWVAGCDGEDLTATWRLARKAENYMLGPGRRHSAAATEPRKYTRLTLFDQGDSRIMHGIARHKGGKGYYGRCLYAQKESDQDMSSVFVGLIEPYAGQPSIASARQLPVRQNDADALRAAVVEVKTANGRTDLLFADGRPEKTREMVIKRGFLGAGKQVVRIAAEYAYISRDAQGLRQATVTGGSRLEAPGISIQIATPRYEGTVKAIDYLARQVTVAGAIPVRLAGRHFEVGGAYHRTSYETEAIRAGDGETTIVMRKGLEIMRTRVRGANPDTGVVTGAIAMFRRRGRDAELVASNDQLTRFWRVAYTGGDRHAGHAFALTPLDPATATGPVFTPADFPAGAGLRVWEFGAGDKVGIQTGVSLQRRSATADAVVYRVHASSPCEITLAGAKAAWSTDGVVWTELPGKVRRRQVTVSLREAQLAAAASIHLKIEP